MQGKNHIRTICRELPLAMVKIFGNKTQYSIDEVDSIWDKKFQTRHNIKFAYALFYANCFSDVLELNQADDLRQMMADLCLGKDQCFSFNAMCQFAKSEMESIQ